MPPPDRTNDDDYHFHAYDYDKSAERGPWGLSDAQPDRDKWKFYSMVQDLTGLRDYGRDGTHVPHIALTNVGGPIGVKNMNTMQLSFGSDDPGAPVMVITGGIHAREWVAAEFVYLLAEYLVMHYATDPGGNDYKKAIKNLIDSRQIRIIPMLNPAAINYTVFDPEKDARYRRKNLRVLPATAAEWVDFFTTLESTGRKPNTPFRTVRLKPSNNAIAEYEVPTYSTTAPPADPQWRMRELPNAGSGVDLNRNCDTLAWGYDGNADGYNAQYNPERDAFFGPHRGSETETGNNSLILQQGAASNTLAVVIDYHCFGQMILIPSEAYNTGKATADYLALGQVMQYLIAEPGHMPPPYAFGSVHQVLKIDGTGSFTDRAAQQYPARALAIELDPANTNQGREGFNLNEKKIRMVFEKNIRGALAALAAPGRSGDANSQAEAIRQAGLVYRAWNVFERGNRLPDN